MAKQCHDRIRSSRFGAATLAVVAVAALAACSSGIAKSNTPSGGSATTAGTGAPFKGPTSDLKPYDPSAPAGAKPNVPRKIAFANQADAGFFLDLQNGIKAATDKAGIQFLTANANGDPSKNIEQLNSFLQVGIGVLVTTPVASDAAQMPIKTQALNKGIGVFSFLSGPSLNVGAASQYDVGYTQGKAAADYITANMGGKANVVYFNADQLSPILIPRHKGALAGLATAGSGVKVVADQYNVPGVDSGNTKMTSILQAHPDVNVVFGDDDSVVGALNAVKAAGKQDQVKYMSGINGSAQALSLVKAGNTPFKASFGFQYGVLGYEWGKMAGDYLDGKSIPQVLLIKAIALTSASDIDAFNAATKDPASADVSKYMQLLGNVSYATRGSYVDYSP